MFERFTQEARQVVVSAQEAARELGHNYIGTEHLLLGCFANIEIGAGAALTELGLNADHVREQLTAIVGPGEGPSPAQIPFTPRAKKAMELALRESLSRGHVDIESLHLLLGLIQDRDSLAMQTLLGSGLTVKQIRETAIAMIPAGEQVDRRGGVTEPARGIGRSVSVDMSFRATPDPALRRRLMAAAGRALAEGRQEFGVDDLRAVLDEDPPTSGASPASPSQDQSYSEPGPL